jgi:colanic acid/amylovoran biosynthesis protein
MRILIDPGSHHLLNVGDVAMLQVCVERLRARWPDARIQVLTTAPELLALHCPDVEPLAAAGRYALTEREPTLPALSAPARILLALAGRRLAGRQPEVAGFVEALLGADLLTMSGRGGLTDAFASEAAAVLTELRIADRIGLPALLMSQGVGPLENPRLRARARSVLSTVRLIAVREGLAAPTVLQTVGVLDERIVVTGDDAIEPTVPGLVPQGPTWALGCA